MMRASTTRKTPWCVGAALLCAGLVLVATESIAAACGVGTSGDSSSDDSSSDDSGGGASDYGSSSDSSSAPSCVESSRVVGRAECSRFGQWRTDGIPAFRVSFGTTVHGWSMDRLSFSGSAEHDIERTFRVAGTAVNDNRRATAATFDLRLGFPLGRHAYGAVTSSVGGVVLAQETAVEVGGGQRVRTGGGFVMDGGLAIGTALPLGDNYRLRGELAVTARRISLAAESTHLDCVESTSAVSNSLAATPTVALDRWLSPFLSASLSVGSNLVERGDLSVGVALAGHFRAFDRAFRR